MPSKILLEGVEILVDSRELVVHGELKHLPWRAFDVLLVLANRPGEVVIKEDLLRQVWGGEVVDGSNLTQAVAQIRKVLGDRTPGKSYIETVPRIGYRMATQSAETPPALVPNLRSKPIALKRVIYATLAAAISLTLVAVTAAKRNQSGASAGVEVPFTALEGDELSGSFSPDGREVVFTWARQNGPAEIYLKAVDSEIIRPFLVNLHPKLGPVFSPDGRSIAFLQLGSSGSSVVVKPRDRGPERILTTISNPHFAFLGSPGPYLAWTKDGKGLIYTNNRSLQLWRLDQSRSIQLTQSPANAVLGDTDPALSPDGSTLVFSRVTDFGSSQLYRLKLTPDCQPSGPPVMLFADGFWNRSPAWHPDGRHVVFTSGPWGQQRLRYIDSANSGVHDPGSARVIPDMGADAQQAAISPSGKELIYTRWVLRHQIWTAPLVGAGRAGTQKLQPVLHSTRADGLPRFSRDGSRLVFQSDRSGAMEVWTSRADGSELRKVTSSGGTVSGSPDLSPDGTRIVFDRLVDGQRDVFLCDLAGGNLRRLTTDAADDVIPRWSADGRSVYFESHRDGAGQIWKMNLDTGNTIRMTANGGSVAEESSDGKTLFFTPKDDRATPILAMPASGGDARQVLSGVVQRAFAITREGIYYVPGATLDQVRFFSFSNGSDSLVLSAPDANFRSIAVDPSHKTIAVQVPGPAPGDLMMIRALRLP